MSDISKLALTCISNEKGYWKDAVERVKIKLQAFVTCSNGKIKDETPGTYFLENSTKLTGRYTKISIIFQSSRAETEMG